MCALGTGRLETALERDLALQLESNHDAKQRGTFNEGGQNECGGLNTTSRFGLTRHAFNSRTTDTTDAHTGADHGTTSGDARANGDEAARIRSTHSVLQQSDHFDHDKLST